MAQGLAEHFLNHSFDVFSAGSKPADKVHPMAVAVMAEIGIDISRNTPRSYDKVDLSKINMVVLMCRDEECPLLPKHVKVIRWPIVDPVVNGEESGELQIKKFRKIRDDIRKKIKEFEESRRFNG